MLWYMSMKKHIQIDDSPPPGYSINSTTQHRFVYTTSTAATASVSNIQFLYVFFLIQFSRLQSSRHFYLDLNAYLRRKAFQLANFESKRETVEYSNRSLRLNYAA